jgi:4-amino-4-deoxychorismate lyase
VESPICPPGTRLIETFGWDGAGFVRLDRHLARMRASAAVLGFAHGPDLVRQALEGIGGRDPLRVRLTLGQAGDARATIGRPGVAAAEWRVALHPQRLSAGDPLLRHKTTARALYDTARADLPEGIDEWIFANREGELCEGTITSLFFDLGAGMATPPIGAGCLPGVLRGVLLDEGRCHVAGLSLDELPRARLWIGNSLRGLIPARLVDS